MSGQREIKRTLDDCMLDGVDGYGDTLIVKMRAWRTTKAGTRERYELELKVCRYSIKQLLGHLKQMHMRDRDRIASEQMRIQNEIDGLKVTA